MNNNEKNNNDNKNNNNKKEFKWKQASRTSLMWIVIIISTIILFGVLGKTPGEEITLTYSQYKNQLESGNIKKILVIDKKSMVSLLANKHLT
jgi:hypothetical protein